MNFLPQDTYIESNSSQETTGCSLPFFDDAGTNNFDGIYIPDPAKFYPYTGELYFRNLCPNPEEASNASHDGNMLQPFNISEGSTNNAYSTWNSLNCCTDNGVPNSHFAGQDASGNKSTAQQICTGPGKSLSDETNYIPPNTRLYWTPQEDELLKELVRTHGEGNWSLMAKWFSTRNGKQLRMRWNNHCKPGINKDEKWTEEEDAILISAHSQFGNQWSKIAQFLPGRTENGVKNHWNTNKRKNFAHNKERKPVGMLQRYIGIQDGVETPNSSVPNANHTNLQPVHDHCSTGIVNQPEQFGGLHFPSSVVFSEPTPNLKFASCPEPSSGFNFPGPNVVPEMTPQSSNVYLGGINPQQGQ